MLPPYTQTKLLYECLYFPAETTLGIKMNSQSEPDLPFLRAFENCCRIDAKRICQPWLYNDTINKIFNRQAFLSYARSKEFIWKFMNKVKIYFDFCNNI